MRSFRMPILGLMGVVFVAALGAAALTRPSEQGVQAAYTILATALLFAIVAAVFGRYRTFWIGFAVFGWGYAVLALAPGAWTEIRPHLATTALLNPLARAIQAADLASGGWNSREIERFLRIGHALAAALHGAAGGCIAVLLDRRRRVARDPSSEGPRDGCRPGRDAV